VAVALSTVALPVLLAHVAVGQRRRRRAWPGPSPAGRRACHWSRSTDRQADHADQVGQATGLLAESAEIRRRGEVPPALIVVGLAVFLRTGKGCRQRTALNGRRCSRGRCCSPPVLGGGGRAAVDCQAAAPGHPGGVADDAVVLERQVPEPM
jgi:hypothetical protein